MGIGFGHRLREQREKKRMTQAELARLCGLGESTISFYEKDKREPSYEILLRLAEKLGTTPNYLLTGKDDGGYRPPWWKSDTPPTDIELEDFIREEQNLRIFGDPLDEDVKDDVMLALRAAWEALKKERDARKKPKKGK